jgi:hypothetical protein
VDRLNIGNRIGLERNIREWPICTRSRESRGRPAIRNVDSRNSSDRNFERREILAQAAPALVASFLVALSILCFKMDFTSQLFVPIVIVGVGSVGALFLRAYWRLRWLKQALLTALWITNELKW